MINAYAAGFQPSPAFQRIQSVYGAKSGYWRLFYTKLQEESLKKDEERKKKAKAEPEKPTVSRVKKPRLAKVITEREERLEPLPQLVLTPIIQQPTVQDLLNEIEPLTFSPSVFNNAVIITLDEQRKKRRRTLRRKAAALLLLAA